MRLKLEQWKWLTECFQFDSFGEIAHFPTFADIRTHVESRLRESPDEAPMVAAPGD
jgi:hypothetical protein